MGKATEQLEVQIGARPLASYNRTMNAAAKSLNAFSKTARLAGKVATAVFASTKIIEFGKDAAETYKGFDSAMKNTSAIMNATVEEYEQLEAAAREAGRTTTKTAEDSANALGYMALAGWDVQKSVKGLTPILHLAEATQKDLKVTSDLVTDSMSALDIEVDGLSKYLDKLAMTNNSANTSAEQLMYALVRSGGAARTLKMDTDDLYVSLGILANNGRKGEQAGTAMNSILTRLGANTEAQKALEALNIQLYDANDNFIGFEEILTKVNEGMEGMSASEQNGVLKQLAGTRYYSQFKYLLDAVKEGPEGAASSWDTLAGKIDNADGSLERMRNTATSSLEASQKLFESAFADLQIETVDIFADDFKETLRYLAESMPEISEHLSEFESEHHDEIVKFIEDVSEGIVNLSHMSIDFADWVMDHGPLLEGIIAGLFGAAVVDDMAKIAGGISNIISTAGGLIPALTNPVTLTVAGVGALVGVLWGVHEAIKKNKEELSDASWEEHFGNVALSASEIEEAASNILGKDSLARMEAFDDELAKMDSLISSIENNTSQLDKTNWKIHAGLEVSGSELEDYKQSADSLVKNVQEYIDGQTYSLSLAGKFMTGESELDSTTRLFWQLQSKKAAELGDELNKAIEDALGDGIIDPEKELPHIMELQNALIEMQQEMEEAKYDVQMDALSDDITGKSFEQILEKAGTLNEDRLNSLEDAKNEKLANLKVMKNHGFITNEYYIQQEEQIKNDFRQAQLDAITQVQGELFDWIGNKYGPEMNDALTQLVDDTHKAVDEYTATVAEGYPANLEAFLNNVKSTLDTGAQENLKQMLEDLKPQKEEWERIAKEYEEATDEIPQQVVEGLRNYDMLAALAGEGSLWDEAVQYINEDPQKEEVFKQAQAAGEDIPEELVKAMNSQEALIDSGISDMYSTFSKRWQHWFGSGFHISVDIGEAAPLSSTKATSTEAARSEKFAVMKNAEGGIYNSPILTTFAEEGPEAAIPINKTPRARRLWEQTGRLMGAGDTNNTQSVTYSPQIIVQGNANKQDIVEAQEIGLAKFKSLYNEMIRQQRRLSFSGA